MRFLAWFVKCTIRIVILLSIPVGAYNFGTVRDSLGVIPEPSGAPG
jgi:hypothetical protein